MEVSFDAAELNIIQLWSIHLVSAKNASVAPYLQINLNTIISNILYLNALQNTYTDTAYIVSYNNSCVL